MSAAGFRFALALIGALAFCAIAAPWLGLRDPNEQLDGLVLADLAPLTRVDAVQLVDGTLRFGAEIRITEGAIELRRGPRWDRVALTDLHGGTLEAAHRRPLFVLGTDGFGRDILVSPEQAAGEKQIDGRSDLYSLGIIGYQMLSGQLPFEGETVQEILVQHMTKQPIPLKTRRSRPP